MSCKAMSRCYNKCEIIAYWTSDDWRLTGLFNYRNNLLIELCFLYRCHEALVEDGKSISTFFRGYLSRHLSESRWTEEHPNLAEK